MSVVAILLMLYLFIPTILECYMWYILSKPYKEGE